MYISSRVHKRLDVDISGGSNSPNEEKVITLRKVKIIHTIYKTTAKRLNLMLKVVYLWEQIKDINKQKMYILVFNNTIKRIKIKIQNN